MPSAVQHHSLRSEDNEGVEGESKAKPSHTYRLHGEAESNKENVAVVPEPHQAQTTPKRSMYEKDPQAVIISPIGDQDSDHIGQEIEISSDEGFQAQAESSNAAVQRRLKPGTKRPASKPLRPQRQSPKKVRVLENIDAHTFNDSADVARGEEETQLPPHRLFEEYTRANESAKQWTAVATKQPQRRSAWTSEETEMLLVLITEWGTSWKFLKEQDLMQEHVLEDRDQVALKDKARNMKMDFLKYVCKLNDLFGQLTRQSGQVKTCHKILSASVSASYRSRDLGMAVSVTIPRREQGSMLWSLIDDKASWWTWSCAKRKFQKSDIAVFSISVPQLL